MLTNFRKHQEFVWNILVLEQSLVKHKSFRHETIMIITTVLSACSMAWVLLNISFYPWDSLWCCKNIVKIKMRSYYHPILLWHYPELFNFITIYSGCSDPCWDRRHCGQGSFMLCNTAHMLHLRLNTADSSKDKFWLYHQGKIFKQTAKDIVVSLEMSCEASGRGCSRLL